VPHDRGDEPVSKLLKRIAAERIQRARVVARTVRDRRSLDETQPARAEGGFFAQEIGRHASVTPTRAEDGRVLPRST